MFPGLVKSIWALAVICLVGRNTWAFEATLLEKESVFLRDMLAQKLVAELTVDPGEGKHTPGQYLGCGLSIAFGFPEISYRIYRHDSRIQPRHWKEQRREMRKKRDAFVTYAYRGILCLQYVEL